MNRQVLLFFSLLSLHSVIGQVSYSIPEEMAKGSLVGNIAQDLGLEIKRLISGKAKIYTRNSDEYIELNRERGVLLVKDRIDREVLCTETALCALHFQIILENPMEFYTVTVQITDINDNAPTFEKNEMKFKISETAVIGAKFVLARAVDLDVGINDLQNYKIKPTDNFALKLHDNADGHKNVEMVLQKPLDREKQEQISLVLTAVDGGEPQMSGTMLIVITVLDANDNAPVFTQPTYKATVTENSPKGTVVATVTASDADQGSNGKITYSITNTLDNVRKVFEVNEDNGDVSLIGDIDFEKSRNFRINLLASDDGGLTDSCKLIVDVQDINDNKPEINIMSKSNVISEDAKLNTVVTMINIEDLDSGENGNVKCFISDNVPFILKTSTDNFYSLVTDSDLDRERSSEYNITVTCSDEGVPSLSSSVTLTLQISDVNDNAPVFERSSYEAYIVENNTPGLSIFTVKARDADWNQNARVSYILEDSSVNGVPVSSYVSVSADSGVIHAVRSFDYEQIKDFHFRVKAQDGGSPPLSSNVSVKILIQDQNDNPPQVLYPVQTGGSVVAEMVPRSADVGYLVTKVVAVDVDSGQNAWLSYKLQKATDRALFEVGLQNGEIRTIRQVTDKDAVKQRLSVIVEDNGQPSRSATVIVNVAVADSFPEVLSEFTDFPHDKEYNDNLTFYLVLALAVVSFLFITCLVVIISVKIYRWRQSRILYHSSLPVIPYYPPRYSDTLGTGTLQHVYNYEVCRTTDSRKSDCKFGRAGSQNVLIMDPSSTGTMQRIQSDKSILDEPDSPLEVRPSVTLTLQISDVNDNAPVFERSSYEAYIVENNTPGLSIFTVKARDADWNQNARVSYILEDSSVNGVPVSSYVSVNADSGVIHAVRSFDYEQIKDFHFRVKAQDGGSPPLSSNVSVKILIQDQNDNPPQVLYPVQTGGSVVAEMVPRSADVGYLVTKVVAVDVDSGQNAWLSYKLQKATDRALFEVGLQNGEIRTIRQVTDKDAVKQRLSVIVEDNGQPSRSATVIVNVAVADSFPEVLSEFTDFAHDKEYNDNLTFYLVLALAVVSFLFITCVVVIISVKIYRWRQSRILYHSSLPVIPYYPPRYSDTLGTGTLQHVYNYEVCRTTDSRKSDCKFGRAGSQNVLIMDPSSTGTMQQIQSDKSILDEPDSPLESASLPDCGASLWGKKSGRTMNRQVLLFFSLLSLHSVIGQVSYSIPEEMAKGSLVGNIAQDLGLEIKRLISGKAKIYTRNSDEYIELNRERGVLLVKDRIDREVLCTETALCALHFQIILENPMEFYTVTVQITDINDNAPTFEKNEINFKISESAVMGGKFVLERAEDLDVGNNGVQNYELKPTDNFALKLDNAADGHKNVEMVLQKPLDREKQEQISLVLTAVDGGEPQMSGTMLIVITVLDVNDNAPVFTQPTYKATVTENSPKGTVVATVTASDADEGSNGKITYSITNTLGNVRKMFEVNRDNGEVFLIGNLDFEKSRYFQINLRASDDGGLTDSCKLIVDVQDVNDNKPEINIMSKSNVISEDAKLNTVVTMINIEDLDSGENGQVKCFISDSVPFILKTSTNNFYSLVTDSDLDRERSSEYNITVTCSDEGVPSLSSSVTLTLQISDVNDNAPVFERSSYEAYIVENNTPGLSIFTVKARDADWNQNARVSYILEDSSVNGVPVSSYVSVNADSGVIHAVRSFDYEQIKDFHFRVKAQDGGSPPLSSNVSVKILIQDQNDNPPQVLYPVQTGGSVVAEMVPRSADVGYLVTKVVAVDVDSGQNAWLSYKLQKATDRALFEVGLQNGEIRTIRQVTDKDAVKQRLSVIVEDNGQPSRSATVIVNVAVADSFPEVLSEFTDFAHDKEYNDNLTFYLVLALAVVSFLFITCVVVIISVKIYRWRQSRILYHSSLPVIPYYPPRYSDTLGTGTLQHVYNYEVCRTTDSRKSDCKFGRAGSQNVLIMDPSSTGTMQRLQSDKSILDEPDSPLEVSLIL
ncbi:uncharacterized protein LOC117261163 [Epinephelus lanceolatus]